jgi:hypothetical protein
MSLCPSVKLFDAQLRAMVIHCVLKMETFIANQLIIQLTNAVMLRESFVTLPSIQVLSRVHCYTPLLQTTALLSTIAFGLMEEVQNMKLNVATSSGTLRVLVHME